MVFEGPNTVCCCSGKNECNFSPVLLKLKLEWRKTHNESSQTVANKNTIVDTPAKSSPHEALLSAAKVSKTTPDSFKF